MSAIYPKPEHEHRELLLYAKKRRLQELELQAALLGFNTPPEVVIEMETLRSELKAGFTGTKTLKKNTHVHYYLLVGLWEY